MNKKAIGESLRKSAMIIVLIVIALLFHILTNGLIFTPMNLTNLILQNSYVVILILGMLPCILTGNIDLSVGSVLAFVGAVAAIMQVKAGIGFVPTLLISLLIGIGIGMWQGMWIAYFDIPAFIVTLAGELIFRGLTQVILDGASIGPFSPAFRAISASFLPAPGGATFATTMIIAAVACIVYIALEMRERRKKSEHGIALESKVRFSVRIVIICAVVLLLSLAMALYEGYPTVLILMLVLSIVYTFITQRTIVGRSLYAIGGNRKAAALSGIKDRKTMFLAYTNMGLMAAVAGIVYASRLNAATPKAGVNFELDAIAACYVGGAAVAGGAGTIPQCLIGCFVIAILNNGMSMMGVSADWQQTVKGFVILFAVVYDILPKRKKK